MKKYIAKPHTWFDEGTEAVPVTDIWDVNEKDKAAIFLGTKNGEPDKEQCHLDEFDVIERETTPKQFKEAMEVIIETDYDPDSGHVEMDNLMCELLKELGFGEGVEIFKKSERWYS